MCCTFLLPKKSNSRGTSDLITAEACPQHLFFNIDDYPRLGTLIQMNPSIDKSPIDSTAASLAPPEKHSEPTFRFAEAQHADTLLHIG